MTDNQIIAAMNNVGESWMWPGSVLDAPESVREAVRKALEVQP